MSKHSKDINDFVNICNDMWLKGWCEANAGNISMRMSHESAEKYNDEINKTEWIFLNEGCENLANDFFIVTASGCFLKNISKDFFGNAGIIQIDDRGKNYKIIKGFNDNSSPTSELASHLAIHSLRKKISNGNDKVVVHAHPSNLISLTNLLSLDSEKLTRLLWEIQNESIIVFPDGVGYLPWMLPGSSDIAPATAALFEKHRLVVWQFHGVLAAGKDTDTAFGLIDTAEKEASIYLKCLSAGGIKYKLTNEQIKALAKNYNVNPIYPL